MLPRQLDTPSPEAVPVTDDPAAQRRAEALARVFAILAEAYDAAITPPTDATEAGGPKP